MAAASLVIAVVAIIVALASAVYTRRQAIANERSTAIEDQRRHDELTPQITVTCEERAGSRGAEMTLELTGPAGLDRLAEVTVRIRDHTPARKPALDSQLAEEQVSDIIWGPYRFNPGQHRTSPDGRAHGPFGLSRSEPYPVRLEQSIPPSWIRRGGWARYRSKPIRLEVTCRRDGHGPWTLHYEINAKPDPAGQVM